jgi:hypothetical protein
MVWAQEGPHVLRVGLIGAGSEADQVAEQHRDDLALFHDGSRCTTKWRPAAPAEPKAVRILLAAARAPHQASSMALTCGWRAVPGCAVCSLSPATPPVPVTLTQR